MSAGLLGGEIDRDPASELPLHRRARGYRGIQNGFDAVFTTAAAMIDELSAAFRTGRLAEALQTYTHPAVLVVD